MIISVNGKIGSGKDTIGNIIQYLTDKNVTTETFEFWYASNFYSVYQGTGMFEIKKFADKIKTMVCLLLNCSREQLEDHDFKNTELGEEWWYYQATFPNSPLISYLDNDLVDFEISQCKLIKLTPRLLMQLLGTECGRDIIHPNIWVNALMSEYTPTVTYQMEILDLGYSNLQREKIGKPIHSEYPNWIITDMRFPNEMEAVKKRKGITIRVKGRVLCRDIHGVKHSITQQEWDIIKKSEEVKDWKITEEHASETALDNAEFDYEIENYETINDLIKKVKEILIKEKII